MLFNPKPKINLSTNTTICLEMHCRGDPYQTHVRYDLCQILGTIHCMPLLGVFSKKRPKKQFEVLKEWIFIIASKTRFFIFFKQYKFNRKQKQALNGVISHSFSSELYRIFPCEIQNWIFQILYDCNDKNVFNYVFGSDTKAVKPNGQPGDSSVSE